MADPDDRSEQLDADKLGDDPFDDDMPGTGVDYPPDRSMGVEDPSLTADDDLATRAELRQQVQSDGDDGDVVLVDPHPTGIRDLDETLTADGVEAESDLPAEEAAVHVVDDEGDLADTV